MEDEVKCLTGCEPGSVWKVVEVVNRMYLDTKLTHTRAHTYRRKDRTLTSDNPGRPQPESDTSCRLKKNRKICHDKKGGALNTNLKPVSLCMYYYFRM